MKVKYDGTRCCQYVKDRNFESNSQRLCHICSIHVVVVSMSKIEISKAIHNEVQNKVLAYSVVVSMSKIEISKAIHNTIVRVVCLSQLLSVCQR